MKFKFIVLVFVLTYSNLFYAQSAKDIRKVAEEALSAFDVPGFSVGVIRDGEVLISEGFGTRAINKSEPVDGQTIYAIASNTKAYIATAIAKLHEEGKLDLDAPVQKYLPYFQLYDEYVSQHTIVRDLLCHRVGLGTFSGDAIWYKSEKSAEEVIKQIKHLPKAYEWRGGYGYTNLMFITAGEVIKSVTGQNWDEYIETNFLKPLDMGRTKTSVLQLSSIDNVATPHITHRGNLPIKMAPWEASGAAGGILSCTDDMLIWINMQLYPTVAERRSIFPVTARNQCMKPHNPIGTENFYSAGLGWFLYMKDGHRIVTHGGGYDGMYSRVIMIPDLNVGIVVLSNSMTGLPSALGNYIRDSFLGTAKDDWLHQATKNENQSREKWKEKFNLPHESRELNTTPSIQTSQMIGDYNDPLYGEIRISQKGETLTLDFEKAPSLSATLSHWHYDTWEINWKEEHAWFDFGTIQFITDNNQEVIGVRFNVPNDDIFFEELDMKIQSK